MKNRRKILSEVNEFGVLFQVPILISREMEAEQIKAELKVAHIKLDEAMEEWKKTIKNKYGS